MPAGAQEITSSCGDNVGNLRRFESVKGLSFHEFSLQRIVGSGANGIEVKPADSFFEGKRLDGSGFPMSGCIVGLGHDGACHESETYPDCPETGECFPSFHQAVLFLSGPECNRQWGESKFEAIKGGVTPENLCCDCS